MVGDRRVGPFGLDEFVREGIMPDTYVWCKQMADWAPARDVPDVCRYFRQRLSGSLPEQMDAARNAETQRMAALEAEQEELLRQLPPMARGYVRQSGVKLHKNDMQEQRQYPKALPIILYILCLLMILFGFLIKF